MSEEILAAGSTAKMAELTAQDIYEIRESRNMLVRGQADNMPKDGEQLRLMLNQLDKQDQALTSLFTGTHSKDTTEYTFTIVPDQEIKRDVLFRETIRLFGLNTLTAKARQYLEYAMTVLQNSGMLS